MTLERHFYDNGYCAVLAINVFDSRKKRRAKKKELSSAILLAVELSSIFKYFECSATRKRPLKCRVSSILWYQNTVYYPNVRKINHKWFRHERDKGCEKFTLDFGIWTLDFWLWTGKEKLKEIFQHIKKFRKKWSFRKKVLDWPAF